MSFDLSSRIGGGARRGLFIGRYFDIEFYLDYSWFLLAAVVIYTLTNDIFPTMAGGLSRSSYVIMGVSGALLFFLSILLHELGHSLVSQRCGIPVPRITLMIIGGVAEISREPDDARSELRIALGGPVVSVVLAAIAGLVYWVAWRHEAPAVWPVCFWLMYTNLYLVAFNMIPGYPLDGGRILRALLWARSGKLRRATFITSRIGIGFSWFLIACGLYILLVLKEWGGFVFLLIAMFLKSAAESGYLHALHKEVLSGVSVRDVMTSQPACIPADLPLNLAVDEHFFSNHHIAFPVVATGGEFRGLVRLEFLKDVPRERWPYLSAGDLAAEKETTRLSIESSVSAARAMRILLTAGSGRLAVTENGRVVGIITRHDMLHFIRIHTELEE